MIAEVELKHATKTAVIFGSSGLVGKVCLQNLLIGSTYTQVLSFNRKPLQIKHPKLKQYTADVNSIDEVAKYIKGNDLYLCIGTTLAKSENRDKYRDINFTYAFKIAKHARLNGVGQMILVSTVGAHPSSFIYHNQIKGELESSIKKLGFWSTHIFQPSVVLGYREESRIKEELLSVALQGFRFILKGRLGKYEPIEVEKIAKVMIDAAQYVNKGVHIYHAKDILKMYNERALVSKN